MPRRDGNTPHSNRKHNKGHRMHKRGTDARETATRSRKGWQSRWFTHEELQTRYMDESTRKVTT